MTTHIIERMAVEIAGDGEPVICIHGLGGTSNTFEPQMPVLAGRRVVRPDLLCSGRSPLSDKPTILDFAAAIVRLARVLNLSGATLIGHSMGTLVAQHCAAENPSLVRRLILIGALIEPAEAARQHLRNRAETARANGMGGIADQVAQGGTASETKSRDPTAVAFVRESLMRQSAEGYARSCEALAAAYAADHGRIRCPTLLLTGEEDQTAPPSVARQLAERINGATVKVLPRCGHWPTAERPDEVNAEIRRFV